MKLRTLGYFVRQAWYSMWRNAWLSLAAMASVAVSLFILGAFLLLAFNVENIARTLQSNVEIAVFLKVETPRQKAIATGEAIRKLPGVTAVDFIPKEEGLRILSQQLGNEHDLLGALGGVNPLPDLFRVRVSDPAEIQTLAAAIASLPEVEKVNYGQAVVERLLQVIRWLRWLGAGLILMLGLGALFLVILTIRLAIYSRRREISIMKYVGATDWFIRWPFLLEGLFLGLAGAGIAGFFLYAGYNFLVQQVRLALVFVPLVTDASLIQMSIWGLVAGGAFIGIAGTYFSMRRFLRV
ncbi:MAG: cell division transport system permease protein [Clostridia bacterium]|nr:cell division transport system permease protein [Clostridia bacterium]